MQRFRWAFAVLVALAVLAQAGASVWAFQIRSGHPRDPAAFVTDARYYLAWWENDPEDPRYIADDALLAEGDRACKWLAKQPVALWRDGRRFQDMAVNARYRNEVASVTGVPDHDRPGGQYPNARAVAVFEAWTFLCGAEWEIRKPHHLRNPLPPDPED